MPEDKDFSLSVSPSTPCCLPSMPCCVMCPKKLQALCLDRLCQVWGRAVFLWHSPCPGTCVWRLLG